MSAPSRVGLAAAVAALSLLATEGAIVAEPLRGLSLRSPNLSEAELVEAAAYWLGACGGAVPPITVGGLGVPVEVRVRGDSSSPSRSCGVTRLRRYKGITIDVVIDVFVEQRDGTPCFPLADEVAHELGHVMGLADETAPRAAGTIMAMRDRTDRRRVDPRTCGRLAAATGRGLTLAAAALPAEPEPKRPSIASGGLREPCEAERPFRALGASPAARSTPCP